VQINHPQDTKVKRCKTSVWFFFGGGGVVLMLQVLCTSYVSKPSLTYAVVIHLQYFIKCPNDRTTRIQHCSYNFLVSLLLGLCRGSTCSKMRAIHCWSQVWWIISGCVWQRCRDGRLPKKKVRIRYSCHVTDFTNKFFISYYHWQIRADFVMTAQVPVLVTAH